MIEIKATPWFRFLGMNIRGTPPMASADVAHDLRVAQDETDILVAQEFRHRWYWRVAKRLMAKRWGSSPGYRRGIAAPVAGAQPVFFRRSLFKGGRTKTRLLHWGKAKISENRFQRAKRINVRGYDGFSLFAYTTHCVVKGDEASDPKVRRDMLAGDLKRLDRFLTTLVRTGLPVIGQLDANIRKGSASYDDLLRILKRHGATLYGAHGVEYLFVIDGREIEVEVRNPDVVPTSRLRTDHEGRCIEFRLVRKTAA